MLSNLLPGLRELRAPFAAGALWVLAAWMAWEPQIPSEGVATGVASSVYRLRALVPAVASGAALGFLAYLVGSLSVAVFSDAIKSSFPIHITRTRRRFNTLVPAAVEALYRIAADTRQDIEALGVIPNQAVEDHVKRRAAHPDDMSLRKPFQRFWQRMTDVVSTMSPRKRLRRWREVMRHAPHPPPEADVDLQLVRLAVSELDVVTTARLLGKDPDLYSAIDRHRAEVEFRVGVIPPLLALFVAVATRVDGVLVRLALVAAGIVAVAGLCWDALKQQRQAHGLLIDAAADGRVQFPSLDRLRRMVTGVAQMSHTQTAQLVNVELTRAVFFVSKLDSFAPSALAAVEATDQAARRFALLEDRLSPEVRRAALHCVEALKGAARLWDEGVHGKLDHPWVDRGQAAVQNAMWAFDRFKEAVDGTVSLEAAKNGRTAAPDINESNPNHTHT